MRRILFAAAWLAAADCLAQSLEPRSYVNTPKRLNFFILGYGYSTGGVLLDPTIPIEDGEVTVHVALPAYSRSFGLAGRAAKVLVVAPYGWLSGQATLSGTEEMRQRSVHGLGDPLFRVTVNFLGAPALSPAEFRDYKPRTIMGATLQVTAPWGQYDSERLVNLGTNRWSFKPELGVSTPLGRWLLEGALAATLFADNDDFFGGQMREQDPIWSVQGHAIRIFKRGVWVAFDATHFRGGRTTLDGTEGDDELSNWRYGATAALPIDAKHSIKLYYSDGVSTRRGEDFTAGGVAWQYRWFDPRSTAAARRPRRTASIRAGSRSWPARAVQRR